MMFLFDNDEITDIALQQLIKPQIVAFELNHCCGKNMTAINHSGVRRYECDLCGKYIMTSESFDSKTELSIEYERPIAAYGSLSGQMYIRTMKENLKAYIRRLQPHVALNDEQVLRIMDDYFIMRNSNIQRAKPREGVICACINRATKIPIDLLSKFFGLDQSYITEGQKIFTRKLSPFNNISIEDLVDEEMKRAECNKEKIDNHIRKIIIELVKITLGFYIIVNTTIKTKIAGILLYLYDAGVVKYDTNYICRILNIGKNTIYKFYDQFIIALHCTGRTDKLFQDNYDNCRAQLIDYLNTREIPIVPILNKKRLDKYRDSYII